MFNILYRTYYNAACIAKHECDNQKKVGDICIGACKDTDCSERIPTIQ